MSNRSSDMHILLRIFLVLVTIIVCVCLFISLLITAIVLDLRILTSKSTFSTIIEQLLAAPAPVSDRLSAAPPSEMSTSQLTDLVFDLLKDNYDGEISVTKEQVTDFLDKSTLPDFIADKGSGFVEDFINGTANTTITREEVTQLLDENKALIEETFDVVLDQEVCDEIIEQVDKLEIDKVFREEIVGNADKTEIANGITVRDALDALTAVASVTVIAICIVIDLVLMAILFFTNRMRLRGTLISIGIPMILSGLILCAPIIAINSVPDLMYDMEPAIRGVVTTVIKAITPVHSGIPLIGMLLIVVAIVTGYLPERKAAPEKASPTE